MEDPFSYTSKPPWDIDRPQPELLALAQAGAFWGRVLDVGCGTGEHALMCAALGLPATGIDLATIALDIVRRKAHQRGLSARFLHHDARKLAELGETFDTVLDCGLFRFFAEGDRERFVTALGSVIAPAGRYFMLCFSDSQPSDWGSHRITHDEITTDSDGIRAWLATLMRISSPTQQGTAA